MSLQIHCSSSDVPSKPVLDRLFFVHFFADFIPSLIYFYVWIEPEAVLPSSHFMMMTMTTGDNLLSYIHTHFAQHPLTSVYLRATVLHHRTHQKRIDALKGMSSKSESNNPLLYTLSFFRIPGIRRSNVAGERPSNHSDPVPSGRSTERMGIPRSKERAMDLVNSCQTDGRYGADMNWIIY